MKKAFLACVLLLPACAPSATQIKRLGPVHEASQKPAVCKIVGVLPDSPARKSGLQVGDVIKSVNGTPPADAVAVADLIQNSGPEAAIEATDASGKSRHLKVVLNKEKPRLGASCDLAGWRKSSVSAAGNESITVFAGPYALTVSGIIDKGLIFMRVRVSNHSDRPLAVSPALFSVRQADAIVLKVLWPQEVMFFMHGEDGVPLIKPPAGKGEGQIPSAVSPNSVVRQASPVHKRKEDWSQSDEGYVQANANYLNKESFWPASVAPGEFADGLIYFLEPKALPLTVETKVEGHSLSVSFGPPKPSLSRMTMDELHNFFNAQKKGTPVRLSLRSGKVFVGRYSSYDAINEVVWFDTPSGVLLTTSSFGLKYISYAEVISPETDKKTPASEPVN